MASALATSWQRRILGLLVTHPQIQAMATHVERWCAGMLAGTGARRMVIVGGSGNGKTHVLRALWTWHREIPQSRWQPTCRDTDNDGFSCQLFDWPTLYRAGAKLGQESRWEDAINCGLLLLDDLGAEVDGFRSGEPTGLLRHLVGCRERQWTVVTTNIPQSNWAKVWDERVSDRLMRNSSIFDLQGAPSFALTVPRREKKEQNTKLATVEQMADFGQRMKQLREKLTHA